MQYTNTANLPQPLVSAITYSDYDRVGDISVTGLIQPPRIRQLTIRHRDEIVEDVSEGIWRLIGSVGHKILERADTDNHLAEERLTMEIHGWTVSGKADLLGPDGTLDDYKFRSVWAMKEAKPEDEAQLNLYALLYRHNGFEVKRARIIAPLRDWSKLRASREPDYPQVGVVVREIQLWPPGWQEVFLGERVRLHQREETLADDDLIMCTPEERWRKPDTWAIKKRGGKRALRVFTEEVQAECFIADNNNDLVLNIEHRRGVDTRCLHYCAVKEFCSYGKTLAPAKDEEAA